MTVSHVPYGFRLSYTVPLPKEDNIHKRDTVENYKAIFISPIISTSLVSFFDTSSNQFGFKKKSSCAQAIYSVRKVVEHYVSGGSTVNVRLLDLLKAFDKDESFCFVY